MNIQFEKHKEMMNIQFRQYYISNGQDKVKVFYNIGKQSDGTKLITVYSTDHESEKFNHILLNPIKDDMFCIIDDNKNYAIIFEQHQLYKLNIGKVKTYLEKIENRSNKSTGEIQC